ncbi:class A basic helix-loop-helix protein 15 isoform X1 [Mugil cephalus]|uniref:class A basic helix-loop-helix protein 15 isoform X1 n=1 Tax=Mugil cephalus TaxID=48193 RepID=UPI001FB5DC49|nr:class A basic helix-loop-helix protein 15 isoform X1 [Mugil cephalus]
MTGARRMQEVKFFMGGATLVISLDRLNWLSQRRCGDKGRTKSGEELNLWIPSGQMLQADEEKRSLICFCIRDGRGRAALKPWRTTDCRSSSRSSAFSLSPRYCSLLREPTQQSAFTSLDPFVTDFSKEDAWTRLILNMRDIISMIVKNLNMATKQDTITMDASCRFIILCDDAVPEQLIGMYSSRDCATFIGNAGRQMTMDLKKPTVQWPLSPNTSSEDDQIGNVIKDNLNTCSLRSLLKSSQNNNHPGGLSRRDGSVKMKKSVSFDEDVTVYLFDQESPTLELHSEPGTSMPSSNSCNLPIVSLEDSGLEWDDDFLTDCHFQHNTLSLPTQSWAAVSRPERCCLSQTCLFLTYVTESDLEL